MPRLLADDIGIVLAALFGDGGGGHPQLADPDAVLALSALSILKPEEFARLVTMIVIQMGEGYRVDVIPAELIQAFPQHLRQLDALVVGIFRVPVVGEIYQDQTPFR